MANDDLSSDVTTATLAGGIQALTTRVQSIRAELSAIQSSSNTMRAELTALQNQDGIQNLSLDERGQERTYRPFQGDPRPHNMKVQYFSNLPGENFLAWRSQFKVIADYHRWSDEEAKQLMYAYMKGTALESVMDIPLTGPETAKETLDEYQRRFLSESDSQLMRAQFACVVQLPNESVQKLHARMRVLYHLAYPDASTRNDIFLIERFIAALNNCEVQNHVRRSKLLTYADALAAANEETSFILMDLATQAPVPGDTSFIAALRARRPNTNASGTGISEKHRCFYCDGEGHIRDRCPLRHQQTSKPGIPAANQDGQPSGTTTTDVLQIPLPRIQGDPGWTQESEVRQSQQHSAHCGRELWETAGSHPRRGHGSLQSCR